MDERVDPHADIDLRNAQGVIVGDHATMHLHLDGRRPGWWTRSGYIKQVTAIAPGGGEPGALRERDAELAELASFCAGEGKYLWWMAAPWAGKSALLSTFVLHPPPNVEVVSFFITARLAHQSDSTAFTEMLIDQLSAILGESVPGSLTPARADTYRHALLTAAAKKVREEGRRLLLVVDGLDEDRSHQSATEIPSIASLLPRICEYGMQVVVASRPGPELPSDVPAGHPLRAGCQIRKLTTSPYAVEVAERAQQELLVLLNGDKLHRQTLGLITACGGGLTLAELEELTRKPPYRLKRLLGGVFGRTVIERADGEERRLYLFAHETLRESATASLGNSLDAFRVRIHDWADSYRPAWPKNTPQYLLRGYVRMLADEGDTDRLTVLAIDAVRHDRMLNLSGGDAAALSEIRTCQGLILAREDIGDRDLYRLLQLSYHRDQLESRNSNIPADLPVVWAELGQPTRAEALARSITDESQQVRALAGLAGVAAGAGDLQQAMTVAGGITDVSARAAVVTDLVHAAAAAGDLRWAADTAAGADPPLPASTLTELVRAAAATGDLQLALVITHSITDAYRRTESLTDLVHTAVSLGDTVRATELAEAALHTATGILELPLRAQKLADLVRAVGRTGDARQVTACADAAEGAAKGIPDKPDQDKSRAAIARAVAAAGQKGRAEQIALSIEDEEVREQTRSHLAGEGTGADERTTTGRQAALRLARDIKDPRLRARVLHPHQNLPMATGHVPPPAPTATQTAARTVEILLRPVSALAEAAVLVADAILDTARHPELARVTGRLTGAAAAIDSGHIMSPAFAAPLAANAANDPSRQARTLTDLVRALLGADVLRPARALAVAARRIARLVSHPDRPSLELEQQATALRAAATSLQTAADRWRAADFTEAAERAIAGIKEPVERTGTLTATARALAIAGDRRQALGLTAAARTAAATVPDFDKRETALAGVASAIADMGDLAGAVEIAREITQWRTRDAALAGLASRAAAADDLDLAVRAAQAMSEPARRTQTLATLAQNAGDSGERDRAVRIAQDIDDPSRVAEVLTGLAGAAARDGDMKQGVELAGAAEQTARSIVDRFREARAFTGLARATAAAGDRHRAADLADLAEQTACAIADPYRQAAALTALSLAMAETGDLERATRVAEAIAQQSEQALALTELARDVATDGDPERAERIALGITDTRRREETLARLATAVATGGDMPSAVRIAGGITEPARHASTLTDLAGIAALRGDPGQAAALFDATVHLARHITDAYRQTQMLAMLAGAVAGSGDTERAVRIADAMTDASRRAHTLRDFAHFEAVAGDMERAVLIAAGIPDPSRRAQTLVDLARILTAAGRPDRAEQIARDLSDGNLRTQTLAEIASARSRPTSFAGSAEQTARGITDRQLQKCALAGLAVKVAGAGDLAHASDIAQRINDPMARSRALADLARRVADDGDLHAAAQFAARISDVTRQSEELAQLAHRVAGSGDVPGAARIAARIDDRVRQGREVTDLAQRELDAGRLDQAVTIAACAADPDRQASALTGLAATAGNVEQAVRITDRIPDPARRATALIELAGGRPAFLAAAERAAASIEEASDKALCLASLAGRLAANGDARAPMVAATARRVADDIADASEQARTLAAMAQVPGLPNAARLIGDALVMASWQVSLPALATAYPKLLREFANHGVTSR
ncbi:hypothetical protein AB0M02_37790 [Actinoplanes sp. NPDC051861]|uniref:hypothetical protein n=1 Tax=Actinoplanes sp. NPDC051861 TaxID=3155170 RepID=UPI00342654B1